MLFYKRAMFRPLVFIAAALACTAFGVNAQSIATNSPDGQPLSQRVVVGVGRSNGVKVNSPVVSPNGFLVGLVSNVAAGTAEHVSSGPPHCWLRLAPLQPIVPAIVACV